MRANGRGVRELRRIEIRCGVQRDPHGSIQIEFGNTIVICAATVADRVPDWMSGKPGGWITAEYSMLPGSTPGRAARQQKGRAEEIQRLVGRSLRAAVDLSSLGARTITVDCDVLQADGGTRTAAITGGYLAVAMAVHRLKQEGKIAAIPVLDSVCAVSCAVVRDECLLDPDYSEDSRADVDMNFVMTGKGQFVEIQGTAEGRPFDQGLLMQMIEMARHGAAQLTQLQQAVSF